MGVARTSDSRGQVKRVMKKKSATGKTSKSDIGSKRKLARFGKRQNTGKTGVAVHYVSRNKAMKQLQISLKDFRRLCILKGIYPRDPPKKPVGKQSTAYYAAKDIAFLHHEPILGKFREMKAVAKKIARRLGRKEDSEARRIFKNRPRYSLDHVVRERYPTFQSCLADLDDGITLIHLFAYLPVSLSSNDHGPKCARLAREWQFYIAKTKSLRKAFVSIKGVYYQAEVRSQLITWLVPHKFSQDVARLKENKEIDFKVMKTFLEFYETLLEFVMFKLYHEDLQASYPPTLLSEADNAGAFLRALRADPLVEAAAKAAAEGKAKEQGNAAKRQKRMPAASASAPASSLEKVLAETAAKYQQIQKQANNQKLIPGAAPEVEDESEEEADEDNVGAEFAENDDEVKALLENEKKTMEAISLFKGLRLFLGREVPLEACEFCVESFGGAVLREDLGDDVKDPTITHQITDRPVAKDQMLETREYVQPQWIFDCVNAKMLLPVGVYSPLVDELPPHLSPFVDDDEEGYRPARAEEILALKRARAGGGGTEALMRASGMLLAEKEEEPSQVDDVEGQEDEESSSDEEEEERAEEELSRKKQKTAALLDDLKHQNDEKDEEEDEVAAMESEEEEVAMKTPEPFIPSTAFRGAKPGFYFRRGVQGLGYYLDESTSQRQFNPDKEAKQNAKQVKKAEEVEAKEMRTIIMSKKAKNLYDRMQHGINRKKESVKKLEEKREVVDSQKAAAVASKSLNAKKKSASKH